MWVLKPAHLFVISRSKPIAKPSTIASSMSKSILFSIIRLLNARCSIFLIFSYLTLLFGSNMSLIVSPMRLKDKTAIKIKKPGVKSHGR